ncbi:epimerase [Strigomonas culicis]|uniref:Epimerase n=1 Tax=Strigomonas culicis TaxID=28005 RepID=S9U907_9TRYP|nr:PhzF family phenazine biosynthesis protein [Strigomonas culicis]EPY25259.1 epimerase [Strigomonas culicis]EPY30660.1 epimerase [Strigomonas culicis]|eukprot:EPY19400.1 PhzF family phenazine biosynthesis protein [Strigomonas culicis]
MTSPASTHPVSTPFFVVDAFAEERFKGAATSVCMVPTSVYCMEWSQVDSLEASFGRGEPEREPEKLTEEQRESAAQRYAEERDAKMGRAFQGVAREVNHCETTFVYRLPASRVKAIQDKIKDKTMEMEGEYEKKVDEERRSSFLNPDDATFNYEDTDSPSTHHPGGIPSSSFSVGNFGASFLQTRSASITTGPPSKARRLHTQWFGLRWFTPKGESRLCGHGTIAAAHSIFETARLCHHESTRHLVDNIPIEFFIPAQTDVLCFVTSSGVVSVRRKDPAQTPVINSSLMDLSTKVDKYEVHFPTNESFSVKAQLPPNMADRIAAVLGLPYGGDAVDDIAIAKNCGYYVVRLAEPAFVRQCKVDHIQLVQLFKEPDVVAAIAAHSDKLSAPVALAVTAHNDSGICSGEAADAQIVSRSFAPWMGVMEDGVSGGLHCTIVPYWLRLLQKGKFKVGDRLQCYQYSDRGGSLECIIIGRKAERIALIGSAVTFLRGVTTFPVED